MSIITINLAKRSFNLECPQENAPYLLALAEKLDNQLKQIMATNPTATFDLALVITCLRLLDDKQSNLVEKEGVALEEATRDFQASLTSVDSELKRLLEKVHNLSKI
jgi:cell division protein ZapA (FtsZ GTPase activity inhibitor)